MRNILVVASSFFLLLVIFPSKYVSKCHTFPPIHLRVTGPPCRQHVTRAPVSFPCFFAPNQHTEKCMPCALASPHLRPFSSQGMARQNWLQLQVFGRAKVDEKAKTEEACISTSSGRPICPPTNRPTDQSLSPSLHHYPTHTESAHKRPSKPPCSAACAANQKTRTHLIVFFKTAPSTGRQAGRQAGRPAEAAPM